MNGWGVRIQIGRTSIVLHRWLPRNWEIETSLMNPKEYGFGVWVTRDLWVALDSEDK